MTTSTPRLAEIVQQVTTAFARARLDHALIGGIAVAARGHVRATKDVDFLLPFGTEDAAEQALRNLGFEIQSTTSGFRRYIRRPLREVPEIVEWVDLLFARTEAGLDIVRRAMRHKVDFIGTPTPIAHAEGLIVMKLLALVSNPDRANDQQDIVALLRSGIALDIARIRAHAQSIGADLLEKFDQLAQECLDDSAQYSSTQQADSPRL